MGSQPLLDILQKDLGGWPVLLGEKWSGDKFNIWDQSIKAYHLGYSADTYIFDVSINTDSKNTSRRVLALDQAGYVIFIRVHSL